jgi:hypothetical protein
MIAMVALSPGDAPARLKRGLLSLVLLAALSSQLPVRADEVASVPPAHPVSSAVLALAKEWFHRFQTGDIDRSQLDAQTDRALTTVMVRQEAARLRSLGNPIRFAFLGSRRVQEATEYDFAISFRAAKVLEAIAFGASGKVVGVDFEIFVPR